MMRLGHAWTSRIDQRIAELECLELGLTECIGCGCLSLERYKLSNPDDRAAHLGPGRATGSASATTRQSPVHSWSGTDHGRPTGVPMAGPRYGLQRSKRGKRPL
jgi:hypothetical protein